MTQGVPKRTPTPEDVVLALSKTGFILEYRVAQILREADFNVDINYAFPDPDTGKSREVDALAFPNPRYVKNNGFDISLDLELIVECKSGDYPFVLVGECGREQDLRQNSLRVAFDPLKYGFARARNASVIGELNLLDLAGLHSQDEFTGTQLLRMNIDRNAWKADNNSIYDSLIYPLAKACRYQVNESKKDGAGSPDWRYPSMTYFFPIVVTAGPVFTVDMTTGEPEARRVNWATLRRYFSSEGLKNDFFIDIVTFDSLNDYLASRTLKVLENLHRTITANINLYDPEWLIANLGEPKDSLDFSIWRQTVGVTRKDS